LAKEIQNIISTTKWKKGDLLQWKEVLNRFDDILEKYSKQFPQSLKTKQTDLVTVSTDTIKQILRLTHLFFVYNKNTSKYGSLNFIGELFNSEREDIVFDALNLLHFLAKKEKNGLLFEGGITNQKLLCLSYGFGENTLETVCQIKLEEKVKNFKN
jgi:hypothetical protein